MVDVLADLFSRLARREYPKSLFVIDDVDYIDAGSWLVIQQVGHCQCSWCGAAEVDPAVVIDV